MGYISQTWVDGETPVDAAHMTHIESGLATVDSRFSDLDANTMGTQKNILVGQGDGATILTTAGTIYFGPWDTALYRRSAGILATDGILWAKGPVVINDTVEVFAGLGVPAVGLGGNGDFFIRQDGGGAGATHIYFKTGGAWIGIA